MSSSTKAVLLKLSSGEVLICKVGLPDAAGVFQPVADWTEVVGRVDVDVLELEDVLMLQYMMQPQQQGGQAAPNISISFVPWMAKKARMRASTIAAVSEPPKDMEDYYLSVTSGIQIAHRGPPNLRPVQ